jgi:hypothetical protein
MDTPKFNSPQLNQAFQESRQEIESLRGNLDLISANIKTLEEYLDRQSVRIEVQGVPFKMEYVDFGIILWKRDEKSDRFRLMLEWGNGFVPRTDYETKPLIECTAPIRIMAYSQLPEFIRKLAREVNVAPLAKRFDQEAFLREVGNHTLEEIVSASNKVQLKPKAK